MKSLFAGARVFKLEELKLGELLFDGSETAAGEPNLVRVCELAADGRGFGGQFASLADPSAARLPDDRVFFVWDFELTKGNYRRAVSVRPELADGPRARKSSLAG